MTGRFLAAITPALLDLARVLFERFKGDHEAAKREIKRIKNHGLALDAARADVDAQLEKLEKLGKEPTK